jgi:hypothetical protein
MLVGAALDGCSSCKFHATDFGFWLTVPRFVRETKGDRLEDLDDIFNGSTRTHIRFSFEELRWFIGACWTMSSKGRRNFLKFLEDEGRVSRDA